MVEGWGSPDSHDVRTAVARRHAELGRLAQALPEAELLGPSLLDGWDRMTVICHLRYGAEATLAMTRDAMAGTPTAFYPQGRSIQREATLRPGPGEDPSDVVVTEGSDGDEDARIVGTSSQVLAFLLGRLALSELAVHGSEAFAARYQDAFPPP